MWRDIKKYKKNKSKKKQKNCKIKLKLQKQKIPIEYFTSTLSYVISYLILIY